MSTIFHLIIERCHAPRPVNPQMSLFLFRGYEYPYDPLQKRHLGAYGPRSMMCRRHNEMTLCRRLLKARRGLRITSAGRTAEAALTEL